MTKNQALREEYRSRINRVLDYIDMNIAEELTLDKLASIANFSQFHFHRLFAGLVGETLYQYINRIRLERAAWKLIDNKSKPVSDISYECGFSSPSTFARSFQNYYGMSATVWREGGCEIYSKNRKENSNNSKSNGKNGKDSAKSLYYISTVYDDMFHKFYWSIEMADSNLKANVEIKHFDDMHFAYIRHIGPYATNEQLFQNLFNRIFSWAGPRGLIRFPQTKIITVYHDNPEITEEEKLRISVGLTVPPDTEVTGDIGKMVIPAGQYAVARFEIFSSQYGEAWNAVYGGWLPESGYQPDDRPCFEIYQNDPKQHPEGKHIVDIVVPVKPM